MKLILLAAGKGERLLPLTRNTPKPLLDIGNGSTLIDEQFVQIKRSGVIDEVVLIVGYMAERIEEKVRSFKSNGIRIRTIYNPFYEISNNLASLWCARSEMGSEFMVSNGDNLFNSTVYRGLTESGHEGVYITVSRKPRYDFDDMKVKLEGNRVLHISKEINGEEAQAESVGLSLVSGRRHARLFMESIEGLLRQRENINRFWLEAFNHMQRNGAEVKTYEIDGERNWRELDYHLDLEQVKKLVKII